MYVGTFSKNVVRPFPYIGDMTAKFRRHRHHYPLCPGLYGFGTNAAFPGFPLFLFTVMDKVEVPANLSPGCTGPLRRTTRVSLTIRHVPRTSKLKLKLGR